MSTITPEEINSIVDEAEQVVAAERKGKAKAALVAAVRRREAANQVVRNCDAEIADLKASIADGSFN